MTTCPRSTTSVRKTTMISCCTFHHPSLVLSFWSELILESYALINFLTFSILWTQTTNFVYLSCRHRRNVRLLTANTIHELLELHSNKSCDSILTFQLWVCSWAMTRFRLRAWLNLVLCRVNGGLLDKKKEKRKRVEHV